METIFIPHLLKSPDRQRVIIIDNFIPGLETLTPVRGTLLVRHGGNFFGSIGESRNHRHLNLRSLFTTI